MTTAFLHEYYLTNYTKCSRGQELLASWEVLAFTSHSFMVVLTPLYIFGGFCILYKTPVSMKLVKLSLLNWHIWCCIYDITVTSLMTPYFFFPLLAGFPVGLFGFLGVPVPVQLVLAAAICYGTLFSMTSVFENRFNILPINQFAIKKTSTKAVYYGTRLFLFTSNILIIACNFPDQQQAVPILLTQLPCPSEEFFRNPVFVITHEPPWREYCIALTVITFSAEALQIFFFCGACMYFLFFSQKFALSSKTRDMQVRFFFMACAQISVPVFFLLIPFCYFCFSVFSGYYNQSLNNAFILFLPMHGLSSTIVMLCVHKPYRDYIISLNPFNKNAKNIVPTPRLSLFTHHSFSFLKLSGTRKLTLSSG